MGIKLYTLGLTIVKQTADIRWEFSEISLIALAFTANKPNQWGNNSNFCV